MLSLKYHGVSHVPSIFVRHSSSVLLPVWCFLGSNVVAGSPEWDSFIYFQTWCEWLLQSQGLKSRSYSETLKLSHRQHLRLSAPQLNTQRPWLTDTCHHKRYHLGQRHQNLPNVCQWVKTWRAWRFMSSEQMDEVTRKGRWGNIIGRVGW